MCSREREQQISQRELKGSQLGAQKAPATIQNRDKRLTKSDMARPQTPSVEQERTN